MAKSGLRLAGKSLLEQTETHMGERALQNAFKETAAYDNRKSGVIAGFSHMFQVVANRIRYGARPNQVTAHLG